MVSLHGHIGLGEMQLDPSGSEVLFAECTAAESKGFFESSYSLVKAIQMVINHREVLACPNGACMIRSKGTFPRLDHVCELPLGLVELLRFEGNHGEILKRG